MDLREQIIDILCPWAKHCDTRKEYGCFTKREHWSLCVSVERCEKLIALVNQWLKEKGAVVITKESTGIVVRTEPLRIS